MVARHYSHYLIESGRPIMGISQLMRAVQLCRESDEQVSTLHTSFAKLCLKAKCFQHSEQIIDHHITSVMSGTHPLEIMVYNYYRGLLYTGLQKFPQAIECFREVLSQPTNLCHQVHLEAYQRVTLLNLIVHGEAFDPKTANVGGVIQKEIQMRENRSLESS